jgi:hypothetical protein
MNHETLNPGPTSEQMHAALHDPETPQQVKRILKRHFYGSVDGRREVRSEIMTLPTRKLHRGVQLGSTKPKKPAGMSGRQWKRLRKAAIRIVEGRTLVAA